QFTLPVEVAVRRRWPRRASWVTRWASDRAVQAGVAGASWSIAGTFARGLLPRSPLQQAVATGAVAATHYQLTATAWSALEAVAALPGRRPGLKASLTVAGAAIAGGMATSVVASRVADQSMAASAAATAGRIIAFAGLAGGSAAAWEEILQRRLGLRPGLDTTLVPSVLTGAGVVAFSVAARARRARQFGVVAPDRHAVTSSDARTLAKAAGLGVGSALGLGALMVGEQMAARGIERGMSAVVGRDTGALGSLVAHGVVLGAMAAGGTLALRRVTGVVERRDDVVEPAYPTPPTSPFVSSGPRSAMPFDALGKEGRRFVLMALKATEITTVMGEPAIDPVRVVGGYESAHDLAERARLTVQDMVDCGAFERSTIVIGVPTGVGYFNYTLTEALEYLTLGDCATVVPQYALVPSALALNRTLDGEELTKAVLEGIRDRIRSFPAGMPQPRVYLIGESLGANVALDVGMLPGGAEGIPALTALDVAGGLYLGVPFRTQFWIRWRQDAASVDPGHTVLQASQPDEVPPLEPGRSRHLMLVHHDDPVSKFGYRMILQPPWWMGAPATRPPLVPRQAKFRPITTFVLATVDLLNGMQSKPGAFVRVGHDYRIDVRLGLERSLGLTSTAQQAEAIEDALRRREQQWATRRMVARKLDRARRSIERTLQEWGSTIDVADFDPQAEATLGSLSPLGPLARLGEISGPAGS
ncbi:MAG: alpha/beta-hydrolase family protein, partial [Actinomycetales bacterium]